MSPRVVGLLLVTFMVLHQGTIGQRPPPRNAFYGQQEMLDWECSQKPYQTTCPGPIARFFFNETTQRCEQVNNVCGHGGFFSLSECDNKCTCRLPSSPGTATCPGAYPQRRYFYSQFYDDCVIFDYSGCEGNGNNFMNLNECTMRCNPPREIEREHVMRSMGFQNEQMFEIQAGVHNYGAAPPPLPPPHPPKTQPPPPPRTTHAPPPPPQVVHYNPGHPPPAWGHHPNQVAYPPRHWQHPPRPSYMPAPPPRPWFPSPQPTRFGPGQPGTSNMPNPSGGAMGNMRSNRNRQRRISVPGSSSFSMRSAQKEMNRARQNMLQTKQQNTGRMGMNRRQMNQGRMNQRRNNGQNFNMGGRVTVPPTPVPSMPPTNNNNNNWGRGNRRNRGRNTAFRADPSPPADKAFSGGSLNPPGGKKKQNKGNTTPSTKFNNNNAGTTDYYYYDNAGQTTTAAYYTTQTLWGAFGK